MPFVTRDRASYRRDTDRKNAVLVANDDPWCYPFKIERAGKLMIQ